MRFSLVILAALFAITALSAGTCCKTRKCYSEYFNAYIGTGYREDSMEYTFVSEPNDILDVWQKNEWEKLQILPFWGYVDYRHPCGFVLKLYGDYGRIYDGTAYRHELFEDGYLNFREKACAGRGEVWDMGGGIGYSLRLCKDFWTFTPTIGYDHNEQHYQIFDVMRLQGLFQGLLDKQHHTYRSLWRGPWLGFETKAGPWICENIWLRLGYDWHYMLYRATVFDTIPLLATNYTLKCKKRQKAHGQGHHVWGGIDYYCNKTWSIGLYSSYKSYRMNDGVQVANCNDSTYSLETDFLGGKWRSFNLFLTIGYHWGP